MAEQDDPARALEAPPEESPDASLDRIEAALDRIAARSNPPAGDAAIIAGRLDGLIARLRDALAIATA